MAVSDTTPRAAAIQLQLYREAGPSLRAQIAVELSEAVRKTLSPAFGAVILNLRKTSEDELKSTFLRIVYGVGKSSDRQSCLRTFAAALEAVGIPIS